MIADWASYTLADFIPFTPEVYARLIERVNAAWWPLQLPAVALGLAALGLAWHGRSRPALLLLVPAWVASGVDFHLQHYAELTWAAPWFGAAFLAHATLLLGLALSGRLPEPRSNHGPMARVGGLIALFGLVGYPALAAVAGSGWRGAEVFGLHPDPTAVATLGLVMIALGGLRVGVAALIPLLWLEVSNLTLVALQFTRGWLLTGVVGLAVAGVVAEAVVGRLGRR